MITTAVTLFATVSACVALLAALQHVTPGVTSSQQTFSSHLPGGRATTTFTGSTLLLPAPVLTGQSKTDFFAGRALAQQPWIKAPTTTTARDGLGPIYNARTCVQCHISGGSGIMPLSQEGTVSTAVLRLSIPSYNQTRAHSNMPEPVYGEQLQTQSTALSHQLRHLSLDRSPHEAQPEGYLTVHWESIHLEYPDGSVTTLRKPAISIAALGYGNMHPETQFSLRNAPLLAGMGLLEAIPESAILANVDPDDLDADGISGRANYIWEDNQKTLGRFGWKANRSDLQNTVAAAFSQDIGITNSEFPLQPCTETQQLCNAQLHGNDLPENVELPDALLALTTHFTRHIGVPEGTSTESVELKRGERLFDTSNCTACHTPSVTTSGQGPLANQKIYPFSDMLL
ncbi:MAG: di-heme oxidoredictase family protein, partial [Pseudomonadota bacterium]